MTALSGPVWRPGDGEAKRRDDEAHEAEADRRRDGVEAQRI